MPDSPVTVTDEGPMVKAVLRLPGCPPQDVLGAFINPATLARWWGGELTTDLTPGAAYTVSYPKLGRAMTGEVIAYVEASHLQFTWVWDDAPEDVKRTVLVSVVPAPDIDGTELTITHGPHALGEAESAARTEHREGWQYFLPRLAALLAPAS